MRLVLVPWPDAAPPTAAALRADLTAAGLDVFSWSDAPGATYTPHGHDHDETIVLVAGEMTFTIGGSDYALRRPGDRLLLPAGTVHAAQAGPGGATYLIGS
jgi:quercetin dioxygenase-like cupin family protein